MRASSHITSQQHLAGLKRACPQSSRWSNFDGPEITQKKIQHHWNNVVNEQRNLTDTTRSTRVYLQGSGCRKWLIPAETRSAGTSRLSQEKSVLQRKNKVNKTSIMCCLEFVTPPEFILIFS